MNMNRDRYKGTLGGTRGPEKHLIDHLHSGIEGVILHLTETKGPHLGEDIGNLSKNGSLEPPQTPAHPNMDLPPEVPLLLF